MGETPNRYLIFNDQQQFRLNKINEVKDCFIAEIRERELMSKIMSTYISNFFLFYQQHLVALLLLHLLLLLEHL